MEFRLLFVRLMATLPDNGKLKDVVHGLLNPDRPKAKSKLADTINTQIDRREAAIEKLFRDHPCPYDKATTVELICRLYLEAVRNSQVEYRQRKIIIPVQLKNEVGNWAGDLSVTGVSIFSLWLLNEQKPISKHTMTKMRQRIATIDNPLGKHVVHDSMVAYIQTKLFDLAELDREVTLAFLEIRKFQVLNKRLPKSFDELVSSKILLWKPRDPFGDTLNYSPERRLVWSVSFDGHDDGGRKEKYDPAPSVNLLRAITPAGVKAPPKVKPLPIDQRRGDRVWSLDDPAAPPIELPKPGGVRKN